MNIELDKKLCEKYPKIFVNRGKNERESCMHWGLECGDGWYDVIDSMCYALTWGFETGIDVTKELAVKYNIPPSAWTDGEYYYLHVKTPGVIADQLKEKLATLRFYYHLEFEPTLAALAYTEKYPPAIAMVERYDSFISGIVHYAEILSGRTCEDTGKPGELHVSGGNRGGWYRTVNREHAKTDEFLKNRNYVPVADLPKEAEDPLINL